MEKKLYCSISRANKNHALFFVFNFLFHDFLPFIFFKFPFFLRLAAKCHFFVEILFTVCQWFVFLSFVLKFLVSSSSSSSCCIFFSRRTWQLFLFFIFWRFGQSFRVRKPRIHDFSKKKMARNQLKSNGWFHIQIIIIRFSDNFSSSAAKFRTKSCDSPFLFGEDPSFLGFCIPLKHCCWVAWFFASGGLLKFVVASCCCGQFFRDRRVEISEMINVFTFCRGLGGSQKRETSGDVTNFMK